MNLDFTRVETLGHAKQVQHDDSTLTKPILAAFSYRLALLTASVCDKVWGGRRRDTVRASATYTNEKRPDLLIRAFP